MITNRFPRYLHQIAPHPLRHVLPRTVTKSNQVTKCENGKKVKRVLLSAICQRNNYNCNNYEVFLRVLPPPSLMLSCFDTRKSARAGTKSQLTSANQDGTLGIMSSAEWKLSPPSGNFSRKNKLKLQTEFCRQSLMSLFSSVCWKENGIFLCFWMLFFAALSPSQEEYSLCKSVMEGKALPVSILAVLSELFLNPLFAEPHSRLKEQKKKEWKTKHIMRVGLGATECLSARIMIVPLAASASNGLNSIACV